MATPAAYIMNQKYTFQKPMKLSAIQTSFTGHSLVAELAAVVASAVDGVAVAEEEAAADALPVAPVGMVEVQCQSGSRKIGPW